MQESVIRNSRLDEGAIKLSYLIKESATLVESLTAFFIAIEFFVFPFISLCTVYWKDWGSFQNSIEFL